MAKRKKKEPESPDEPGELFQRAKAIAKGLTLETLHGKTGLGISWLRKFRAGEIKNPSVNRIEKILSAFDF